MLHAAVKIDGKYKVQPMPLHGTKLLPGFVYRCVESSNIKYETLSSAIYVDDLVLVIPRAGKSEHSLLGLRTMLLYTPTCDEMKYVLCESDEIRKITINIPCLDW
jgi:hypothetical protein